MSVASPGCLLGEPEDVPPIMEGDTVCGVMIPLLRVFFSTLHL